MPFRPTASHRRNIQGVIYPLTAAVARRYGIRSDGAYPLGAFYTINIDNKSWIGVGGIWYRPKSADLVSGRSITEQDVERFIAGIATGEDVVLCSGIRVTWEEIPASEVARLPAL